MAIEVGDEDNHQGVIALVDKSLSQRWMRVVFCHFVGMVTPEGHVYLTFFDPDDSGSVRIKGIYGKEI